LLLFADACYGCFFRVGVLPPGAALLNQLSQCANVYLSNTSYAGCATQLAVCFIKFYIFSQDFSSHYFSYKIPRSILEISHVSAQKSLFIIFHPNQIISMHLDDFCCTQPHKFF
jgi:hypothetical protein